MEKLKRVIVKEEFVALTGNFVDAVILNQFVYWSERVRDFDKYILEEKKLAEMHGQDIDLRPRNGWIYKSCEELSVEIMIEMSITNMRNHIKKLIENGWIDERTNPENRWDKTIQYRVNLIKIHKDLLSLGYYLQEYKIDMSLIAGISNPSYYRSDDSSHRSDETSDRSDNISHRSAIKSDRTVCNVSAIPETTTEITTEITTNDLTDNKSVSLSECKKTDMKEPIPEIDEYKKIVSTCDFNKINLQYQSALDEAIKGLYFDQRFATSTLNMPIQLVRESLKKLNSSILQYAVFKMCQAAASGIEIKSTKHYLMKCVFESISEYDTDLLAKQQPGGKSSTTIWDIVNNTELYEPVMEISKRYSAPIFNTFFREGVREISRSGSSLKIWVNNDFIASTLSEKKYMDVLMDKFKSIGISHIELIPMDISA